MILCYWYHLRGRCEYGDKCLYVHDFVFDSTEEYFTGSGRDQTMVKSIDLDDVRMLDPAGRTQVLIERENARLELKRIEDARRARFEEEARARHERWLREEQEKTQRRREFHMERMKWDVYHPTQVLTVEACLHEALVFRCRVPYTLLYHENYIRYTSQRFLTNVEWGDDATQVPRFDFTTIHIRDGDTTDVGFVQFDPKCVLILVTKLPPDLLGVLYKFLVLPPYDFDYDSDW